MSRISIWTRTESTCRGVEVLSVTETPRSKMSEKSDPSDCSYCIDAVSNGLIAVNTRFKIAAGGRLNYFINENVSVRTFGRYYTDDWGINSVTASIEVPVKLSDKWAVYPSYRYYTLHCH